MRFLATPILLFTYSYNIDLYSVHYINIYFCLYTSLLSEKKLIFAFANMSIAKVFFGT